MELNSAFEDFLSEDNDARHQAYEYLINQIDINPMLYMNLIQLYTETDLSSYKKLCLILIKIIVKKKFDVIYQNIQEFLDIIKELILNTSDVYSLYIFADIIYHVSNIYLKRSSNEEIWEGFYEYLILYQSQIELLPFCIYLYMLSMIDQEFYSAYRKFLVEINPEIIFVGLQNDDIEMKIYSIAIFSKISKKIKDDFLAIYQDHLNLIYQIAENSLEMSEYYFNKFWTLLFKIDNQISLPLYDIAFSFFQSADLQPDSLHAILRFIIQRKELISPDYLEDVIFKYFQTQCEIAEIDNTTFIFENLIQIDDEKSYEIFKNLLNLLLTNEEENVQYVGLSLLPNFFEVYQKASVNDISEFLPITFEAASKSDENIINALLFLELFLKNDTINLDDSLLTIDFLIDVIVNCTDMNIQFRALKVCKSLPVNPAFFEKMIVIYENIQPDSFAVYFSILIHFYRVECCINMVQYEPFLKSLIEIFNESIEKVSELESSEQYQEYQEDPEDPENKEIFDAIYNHILICGSSGNLIFYFWFFSPIQFDDYVEAAVENFFNILEKEDTDDNLNVNNNDYFCLHDIKEDFSYIILTIKEVAYDLIKEYSEDIIEGRDISILQNYLCINFDVDNLCAEELLNELEQEIGYIFDETIQDSYLIISTLTEFALPVSKWIYKVFDKDDEERNQIHVLLMNFLNIIIKNGRSKPDFIEFDVYNKISKILLRFVKPKRIEYDRRNEFKLTKFYIKHVLLEVDRMIKNIECIEKVSLTRYFDGFSNLVLAFAYLKIAAISIGLNEQMSKQISDEGHKFLTSFVINFYNENQESTEIKMLNLFTKMIDVEFYTDEEIDVMITIVNGIIEREKNYHDVEISLFELIINLSKVRPEISPSYVECAIAVFNENKENLSQVDLSACCARFLLSAFNQNPVECSEIIGPLIPDILAVFPINAKHKTELFWLEIKSFVEICKDSITREIYESLIRCLTRYLSYQKFTNIIFSVPDEQHEEIIQFYGELIKSYISESQETTFKDILDGLLPEQPTSVDFILSLYSDE